MNYIFCITVLIVFFFLYLLSVIKFFSTICFPAIKILFFWYFFSTYTYTAFFWFLWESNGNFIFSSAQWVPYYFLIKQRSCILLIPFSTEYCCWHWRHFKIFYFLIVSNRFEINKSNGSRDLVIWWQIFTTFLTKSPSA